MKYNKEREKIISFRKRKKGMVMSRVVQRKNSLVGPVFVGIASVEPGYMDSFETYAQGSGLDRIADEHPGASYWGKESERTFILYDNRDRLFVSSASKQTVERLLDEILSRYLKEA